jgi:hypothetical protein
VHSIQDESRSVSENSTWGIRRRFEQGKVTVNHKKFVGYDNRHINDEVLYMVFMNTFNMM